MKYAKWVACALVAITLTACTSTGTVDPRRVDRDVAVIGAAVDIMAPLLTTKAAPEDQTKIAGLLTGVHAALDAVPTVAGADTKPSLKMVVAAVHALEPVAEQLLPPGSAEATALRTVVALLPLLLPPDETQAAVAPAR